jgi:hypothetical protein
MDETEFWSLIDSSRTDEHAFRLQELLTGRSVKDLEDFARIYRTLRTRAQHFDLWSAGYLLANGMSNDGFVYFRDWLISYGRDVYERALADPDSLADVPDPRVHGVEDEQFGYAVYDAYRDTYGDELAWPGPSDEAEPRGTRFEHEDLPDRLPRLYAKWLASEEAYRRGQGT